jgi:hypothetical protein
MINTHSFPFSVYLYLPFSSLLSSPIFSLRISQFSCIPVLFFFFFTFSIQRFSSPVSSSLTIDLISHLFLSFSILFFLYFPLSCNRVLILILSSSLLLLSRNLFLLFSIPFISIFLTFSSPFFSFLSSFLVSSPSLFTPFHFSKILKQLCTFRFCLL